MFLCGAMLAFAGCADFSQDIQELDKKADGFKTELDDYKASTATTIAELQATIDALEATQEKIAAEYAKKDDLQAAKEELQGKLTDLNSKIEAAVTEATTAIANLDAAKADKTAVAEIQEKVNAAIAEVNTAIENLEAVKADQADLELVEKDVESLLKGYEKTEADLKKINETLDTKANQADLDLAEADIEALKTASAKAIVDINDLQAQIDALDARVESLESEMKTVQEDITLHTQELQGLADKLEAVEGNLEDEAAAREEADKALEAAISLLNTDLAALKADYNTHLAELEAYKATLAKEIEDLGLEDALIYKTIQDNFNTLINSIDDTAAAIRAEQATAIAALEKKIQENWEAERALIYNTINDIQSTLMEAIENNGEDIEDLQAQLEQHVADIYKTILSEKATLETMIEEGDDASQKALEDAIADVYKSILSYNDTYEIRFEAIEDELLRIVEEDLTLVYKTIQNTKLELQAEIDDLRKEFEALVSTVSMDVEALLDRVQSIVYVPDYSDGKATLEYGKVGESILPKATVLRYLVNGGDNLAAQALVDAYADAPEAFSYAAKEVLTRSAEYGLEILDVTADTENVGCILVKVRPYGFSNDFWSGQGTSSYSAALVFANEASNYSTAYTNFVAEKAEAIDDITIVFKTRNTLGEEVTVTPEGVTDFKADYKEGEEVFTYEIPSSDLDTVVTAYRPTPALKIGEKVYTVEELKAEGYDLDFNNTLYMQGVEDDVTYTPAEDGTDMQLKELTEGADYSARVGNKGEVWYNVIFNGKFYRLKYELLITNEQVKVTIDPVEINWSVALAEQLRGDDGKLYANTIVRDVKYNVPVNFGPILTETYRVEKITELNGVETSVNYQVGGWSVSGTATAILSGYEFPANGQPANVYKVTWKAYDYENKDYTVTGTIILNPLPKVEPIQIEKDLEIGDNVLYADVDLKEAAYAEFQKISGYAADSDEEQTAFDTAFKDLGDDSQTYTKVNTVDAASKYNFLFNEGWVRYAYNQAKAEGENVITAKFTPWFDIPFSFKVTSPKVNKPDFSLVPSTEFVKDGFVIVPGYISDAGVYTIQKADLGSYFTLNEAEGEYDVTVKFEADATLTNENSFTATVTDGTEYLALDEAVLTWDGYAGLEIPVTATVYANGYPVSEPYEITLKTADPLTFSAESIAETRVTGGETSVKVFDCLTVTSNVETNGILAGENLVNVGGKTIAGVWYYSKADTVYGAKLDVQLVQITLEDGTPYNNTAKCNYDPATGIITFHDSNDAVLQQDVTASFAATLTHNIHGAEAHTSSVNFTVTFLK